MMTNSRNWQNAMEIFPTAFHFPTRNPRTIGKGPQATFTRSPATPYLIKHEDPTEIEYYLCGPPPMIASVEKMLYDLGVEPDMIAFDKFG